MAMSVDTELLLIDNEVLQQQVIPAISDFLNRGDPTAARRLVGQAMLTQQFQGVLKSDAAAEKAIAQYLAKGAEDLLKGKLPTKILDDTGQPLHDPDAILKLQTERILNPFLVLFLCSWPGDTTQTHIAFSRGPLVNYLRSKSTWMDDMLGSSNELLWNAPDMPLPIGGEAKLLTREDAGTLLKRVQEVPVPSEGQELIQQYKTLERLLQIAAENPRFRVLIRTS